MPPAQQPAAPLPMMAAAAKPGVPGGIRLAISSEGRAAEGKDPGPHGVQLPLVPEIAEGREADGTVAHHGGCLPGIKDRLREPEWPIGREVPGCQAAQDRQHRRRDDDGMPVRAANSVEELGCCRAQGQRPDHDAQGGAAAGPEPRGHRLEPRRIHASQERSGEEPQADGRVGRVHPDQQQIDGCGAQRADQHERAGSNDVGQIDERRHQGADNEPRLHGDREEA
jgi:hypothetical protein